MTDFVSHGLRIEPTRDELSRQHFVSGMRRYVLHDLAGSMRHVYEAEVEPQVTAELGRKPADGVEIHKSLRGRPIFNFYSSMRTNCQEMVWRSVIPTVERNAEDLNRRAKTMAEHPTTGSLELDPNFEVPRYVSDIDVHLMPGCYHTEYAQDDVSMAAVYDNGGSVFTMGLFGKRRDDIGGSIALFIKHRYPELKPQRILDLGCSLGTNTLPWAETYPDAEVHAIDVAAPLLRYAHARAQSLNVPVHFHQRSVDEPGFDDESFDIIFSSMLLHELPAKTIQKTLSEAYRMLKPGGLMLHMELPPNSMTAPYDSFYLDWDSYYNREPFYKAFRDKIPRELCIEAGFREEDFVYFIIPSVNLAGRDAVLAAVDQEGAEATDKTGRLSDNISWFCFGATKP